MIPIIYAKGVWDNVSLATIPTGSFAAELATNKGFSHPEFRNSVKPDPIVLITKFMQTYFPRSLESMGPKICGEYSNIKMTIVHYQHDERRSSAEILLEMIEQSDDRTRDLKTTPKPFEDGCIRT